MSFSNEDSWNACLETVKLIYSSGASFYILFNEQMWQFRQKEILNTTY